MTVWAFCLLASLIAAQARPIFDYDLVPALAQQSNTEDHLDALEIGVATRAISAGDEAFHWTVRQAVGSIERTGLRAGSYATPQRLSQMQAHIDLALSPNVARNAVLRIDLAGLRQAGYEIPQITQVGRKFGMPGGGSGLHRLVGQVRVWSSVWPVAIASLN